MLPVTTLSKFFLTFRRLVLFWAALAVLCLLVVLPAVSLAAPLHISSAAQGWPGPLLAQAAAGQTQPFSPPQLSEDEAKDMAAGSPSIGALLSKHPELERHGAYDSIRGIWTIFWTLPGNSRRLITAEISDATGAVLFSDIETEAYLDIIPSLSEQEVIELAQEQQKVQKELEGKEVSRSAYFGSDMVWTVSFNEGSNEVAEVLIDDDNGIVDEVRVGPQVAWQMARGYEGAFGRIINEPYIWLPLCALFVLPFVDIRRPLRLLHLDLLVLLSFTVSHYFFNQGDIYRSVPLAYPPLVYLFVRLAWIAARRVLRRSRAAKATTPGLTESNPAGRDSIPAPELADASVPHLNFSPRLILVGLIALFIFRLVINIADSNVVDVGYSGVIGAHRILEGETPYGHMPSENSNGDTYGPLNYLVYVPFEKILPWSGQWDDLPAAHATAIFFDLLAAAGMFMAGRQLMRDRPDEGNRLGLALAYGWMAFPYTAFVLNCNVNDTITAAFLIWGFVFLMKAPLAGAFLAFAAQLKFAPSILGPLWASFPRAFRGWGRRALFVLGFVLAIAVTLPVIFMGDGSLGRFWERTLEWQLERDSPFSIWGQYPERLAGLQRIGQYFLIAIAVASYFWPPRKTLVQVAAGSAALLVGFQILLTHWFYLYIPWFFPLALIALLARDGKQKA